VYARQISSVIYVLFGNKCVWGLKEKIRKIYNKYAKNERETVKTEDTELSTEDSTFDIVKTMKNLGYSAEEIVDALR
jgi:Holliday junction resolvasome RuvABC DNA-binding subunit